MVLVVPIALGLGCLGLVSAFYGSAVLSEQSARAAEIDGDVAHCRHRSPTTSEREPGA
jgi:hypothetical protein